MITSDAGGTGTMCNCIKQTYLLHSVHLRLDMKYSRSNENENYIENETLALLVSYVFSNFILVIIKILSLE